MAILKRKLDCYKSGFPAILQKDDSQVSLLAGLYEDLLEKACYKTEDTLEKTFRHVRLTTFKITLAKKVLKL